MKKTIQITEAKNQRKKKNILAKTLKKMIDKRKKMIYNSSVSIVTGYLSPVIGKLKKY